MTNLRDSFIQLQNSKIWSTVESVSDFRLFKWLLWIAGFVGMLGVIRIFFLDHDTIIYTLVGKGIYQYGLMPYEYVFDHKPFFLYFVYGLLSYLDELHINSYAILGALITFGYSFVVQRMVFTKEIPVSTVFLVLSFMYCLTLRSSGNSEIIFVPLSLISIFILLRFGTGYRNILMAAGLAALAFNSNYVVAVALVPSLLFALYERSKNPKDFIFLAMTFAGAGALSLAVCFGFFAILGGNVGEYLSLQYQFLTGYSEAAGVPVSARFAFCWILSALVISLQWIPNIQPKTSLQPLCRAMAVYFVFASLSFVLTGKFYNHYTYLVAAPAAIVLLSILVDAKYMLFIRNSLLLTGAFFLLLLGVRDFLKDKNEPNILSFYADLKKATEDRTLLSIRSSVVPIYFSGAYPSQPFNWYGHAKTVFGREETSYYLSEISTGPEFIVTPNNYCTNNVDESGFVTTICAQIKANYSLDQSKPRYPASRVAVGYDLYRKSGL